MNKDLSQICNKLNNFIIVDGENISFKGAYIVDEAVFYIAQLWGFAPTISTKRKISISRNAIFGCAKTGKLESKKLNKHLNKEQNKYLDIESNHLFLFYSQISISKHVPQKIFRHNKSTLTINPKLSPETEQYWQDQYKSIGEKQIPRLPSNYTGVSVTVRARDKFSAFESALENISYFRGLWNMILNFGSRRISSHSNKPLNSFVLSPIYIVCDMNASKGSKDRFSSWYETDYLSPQHVDFDAQKVKQIFARSQELRNTISKLAYSKEIQSSVIAYCHAIDSINWDYAFIKLWGILEILTHTTKMNSSETIKRTSILFEDSDYHLAILEGVRKARNSIAHSGIRLVEYSGTPIIENESPVCLLKHYVEELLSFHFYPELKFKSIEEAGNFLNCVAQDISPQDFERKIKINLRALTAMKNLKKNKH